MLSFTCDYSEGACPEILRRLGETNLEQLPGYGEDKYSMSAKEKIRSVCGAPDADVFFLVGGTQTNSTIIATMLRDFEGVVAAETGHVALHEAGAVEYTGHKVLTIPGHQGKIDTDELSAFMETFFADANHEHMVFPGMVYISFPTEYGTIYTKEELDRIYKVCREADIPLFIDGARLAYGLAGDGCDLTIKDLAERCDVFYLGGTKVGALCGEAVVFPRGNAPAHFMTMVKQHGALLAKGRLLGVQFDTLMTGGLYFRLGENAVAMARRLRGILRYSGLPFYLESPTNQQFIILEEEQVEALSDKVAFDFWEKIDGNRTVVRFCTSWATTDEQLDELEAILVTITGH